MKKYILFIYLIISTLAQAEEPKPLEIGASAPDFSLKGVDGKMYSLKSFSKAKILVVLFTCNHCPTAQAYEERVKKLVNDYQSKGVQVVAIMPNDDKAVRYDELGYTEIGDSYEEMIYRAKEMKYNFPYLYDGENQGVTKKYGAIATPHVFIFDQNRKLQYNGRIDDTEKPTKTPTKTDTKDAIEALLSNQTISAPTTKTFGCSIKWADKRPSAVKEMEDWKKEPVSLEFISEQGIKDLLKNDTKNVRLINVWATWCGPCVNELPEFIKINHMYNRRDFEFITISADKPDKKQKALEILEKTHVSAKNYIFDTDDSYKLIEAIDPKWQGALPYTMIIEPNGKIIYAKQDEIKPLQIKKIIVESSFIGRYF